MQELRDRIAREGRNLGRGILKVDSFINHQVDAHLMMSVGRDLARLFSNAHPTKVLTAEISGIAPALTTALALDVPVIYARKTRPVTMPDDAYRDEAPSHTKGGSVELLVSPEVLLPGDRVLIIDDFLASGRTIAALARLVGQSGATLVGIGTLIEKSFEGGRAFLASQYAVPIGSLVTITDMRDGQIVFGE
ncbi:MAG TPA: xanthine phosphoribosyltransferase [Anaerolineae bacterium]|nr:xanthine phosphoribosyltransferase [Anaerolineae bacterium]